MVFCNISWDSEAEEEATLKGLICFWGCVWFVLEQIRQKSVDMDDLQLSVPKEQRILPDGLLRPLQAR